MEEVIYRKLGRIDYAECWKLQQSLFDALLAAKSGEKQEEYRNSDGAVAEQVLLLCEHNPVYTLGKSGHEENMLAGNEFLKERGATFYHIDRGGDITFHGPGQLVGYPILDLEREKIGLREYIHSLEQAVIDTVAGYGIHGERIDGAAGVWLTDSGRLRKICAFGVRASRYVTMHGFALNVNTDLCWFEYINPCGFSDRGVTSLQKELGREVDMEEVAERFLNHFEGILNVKIKI